MKTTFTGRPRWSSRRQAGFTMVEVTFAGFILTFIIIVMVIMQLFGARMYMLASTKLIASADGRDTLNTIRKDVRCCRWFSVGTFSNSLFADIPQGSPQVGNAVKVSSDSASTSTKFTIYFQNPAQTNICSVTNGVVSVLANSVTNNICFWAEDFQGNITTNWRANVVLRFQMQFVGWKSPGVSTNVPNAYDFYFLRTRISRRTQ